MERMITTKRLVLRPIESGDGAAIYQYAGNPDIDMMLFFPHETPADTEKFVKFSVSEWAKDEPEDREYVILLEGEIIGGVNLEHCQGRRTYELGWIIHGDYRNRGYATEAAEALQAYAFCVLQADLVQAHCDSRNTASEKVMKKLGMTLLDGTGTRCYPRTGVTAGEYLYAITKEEYGR